MPQNNAPMTFETVLKQFNAWYQQCLENGIEPGAVVEQVGEIMLITIRIC